MKENTYKPVIIFSLNPGEATEALYRLVPAELRHEAQGCYKGTLERSWLMQASDFERLHVGRLLHLDGQECALYLDNQRSAYCLYGPGYEFDQRDRIHVGRWREVSQYEASCLTSYTVFKGRYFAAY